MEALAALGGGGGKKTLGKARWSKAASIIVPQTKKKLSFLDAVKIMHARQRACMDVEERKFHQKLMNGKFGPKVLEDAENFAKEICDECLDESLSAEREDVHYNIVRSLKLMQESVVCLSFAAVQQDDKEIERYRKKKDNLQRIISESQRNYMMEMVQVKELMRSDDADSAANRMEEILMYDGLMSLDDELREICDAIIKERVKAHLKAPKALLLTNIQKLLDEGENAFDSKKGPLNQPQPQSQDPGSPMVSPRGNKRSPQEIMAERDKARIEELEKKLKEAETSSQLTTAELNQRRYERDRLQSELDQLKQDNEKEKEDLGHKIGGAAKSALQEAEEMERRLSELRVQKQKKMKEMGDATADLRKEIEAARQRRNESGRVLFDKRAELERLQKAIVDAKGASESNEKQEKLMMAEAGNIKKEVERLQKLLDDLQERERALRKKLTEPVNPPPKEITRELVSDERSLDGGSKGSSQRKSFLDYAEQGKAKRAGFLRDLLAILRAQLLLSTPPRGKSRDWGKPLDYRNIVAPTGDTELAKIVALLSRLDEDVDCSSEGSVPSSPAHDRLSRGPPSANGSFNRSGPHSPDQYWYLAPATAGSMKGSLGESRSCPDIRREVPNKAQSKLLSEIMGQKRAASRPRTSIDLESKTVDVHVRSKPPSRGWTGSSANLRPQSMASNSVNRMPLLGSNLPGSSKLHACICGLADGTVECTTCQHAVPRLSIGWCLPPLSKTEQSAEQSAQ